ncbi:hypothetical protein AGMMS50225_06570 [Betaproteobacteria bacterium]|nr:hypothetical protein AGMMS50225_06570 [Betaproteobacteria bacterium]
MSLAARISTLARRIGLEVKTKIDADHPGVAKAWVCFGYVGGQLVMRASYNVASVTRQAAGRYRVAFATPMPDAGYCWTAQYVDINCGTTSASFADSSEINLTVFC